ncbi:MAG TPA: zf-HC2 domain-containing protein [Acidobacteriota bacterium]|nr:zf-HC2 domain-containing protein [Acidobacteriota bacterium]
MDCDRFRELIVSNICGELEGDQEVELRRHLEECENCRAEHSEFDAISSLMRQIPRRDLDERLHIRELLRQDQKWKAIVFSKAAIWVVALTGFLSVLTFMPLHWEVSSKQFTLRWGNAVQKEAELSSEIKKMQQQLHAIQQQTLNYQTVSESRFKQLLQQNNMEQQKLYWQTLEMYTNYLQLQHQADVRKIQHDIATTYDRTGQEVDRTNQLLEYVLKASDTGSGVYGNE